MKDFYIGLFLALSSSIFISVSFILKKKALLRSAAHSHKRAGQGGHPYLKEWLWWVGVSMLGAGEAFNFAAFAFAPASLVTSLGALSVLVTVVLSSHLLKEKLGFLGKIGCALCLLGATMLVLHAPRDGSVKTTAQLSDKMQHYGFIIFVVLVLSAAAFLIFYMAPRYGRTNILIFVSICSVIGSLTVLGCKGLGLAIKEQFTDTVGIENLAKDPILWLWLVAVVFCISIQLKYLNMALDVFNISMVTSIYYVAFNVCVITATGVLYNEWTRLGWKDIVGSLCGFMTTVIGVFQMQCFNHLDVTLAQLRRLIYKGEPVKACSSSDVEADEGPDTSTKRRRSLVGSSSEPLIYPNHNTNTTVINFGDKDKSRFDEDDLIPVHAGRTSDDGQGREWQRALSMPV